MVLVLTLSSSLETPRIPLCSVLPSCSLIKDNGIACSVLVAALYQAYYPSQPSLHVPAALAAGYQPSVRDFEGLKALARRQGGDAATNRGACKICGGLGHLTKQCRNFLDNSNKAADGAAAAAAGGGDRQLLTADDEAALLDSDSLNSSDLSGSDSSSSSDDDRVSSGLRISSFPVNVLV